MISSQSDLRTISIIDDSSTALFNRLPSMLRYSSRGGRTEHSGRELRCAGLQMSLRGMSFQGQWPEKQSP